MRKDNLQLGEKSLLAKHGQETKCNKKKEKHTNTLNEDKYYGTGRLNVRQVNQLDGNI